MSDLLLGRFEDFKGADTVLLSCTRPGIERLLSELRSSLDLSVAVHSIARVSSGHPTQLFVASLPVDGRPTWVVDQTAASKAFDLVQALSNTGAGHQYFELAGSSATLLVSLGEYSEEWWDAYA